MATVREPKVSVCVVTYNHEPFIADCLSSLLQQEADFDFELIVGDDCSTDGTSARVDAIATSDSRVRVLRPSRNIGATQNLLAVHNAAQAPYIAHLDGDDVALPGKLARQAAILDDNANLMLCGHKMRVVDESGAETGGEFPARLGATFDLSKIIRCGMPVLASSIMYRAEARSLRHSDFEIFDWYLYTDILKRGGGAYISDVLGSYRVNSTSLTSSLAVAGMQERMLRLYALRYLDARSLRGDFFAWAVSAAWTSFRNRAAITKTHWRFLAETATISAVPSLADAAFWILQNRRAMAR